MSLRSPTTLHVRDLPVLVLTRFALGRIESPALSANPIVTDCLHDMAVNCTITFLDTMAEDGIRM